MQSPAASVLPLLYLLRLVCDGYISTASSSSSRTHLLRLLFLQHLLGAFLVVEDLPLAQVELQNGAAVAALHLTLGGGAGNGEDVAEVGHVFRAALRAWALLGGAGFGGWSSGVGWGWGGSDVAGGIG